MGISQRKGLQAETAILNKLIQLGFEVLIPWDRSLGYDLAYLLEKEEGPSGSKVLEVIRIQCKLARIAEDEASLIFNTSTVAEWGTKRHGYHGLAEQFGVYSPFTEKVYMIAVAETGKSSEMRLRLKPPKNNQEKHIKWAKDYEI